MNKYKSNLIKNTFIENQVQFTEINQLGLIPHNNSHIPFVGFGLVTSFPANTLTGYQIANDKTLALDILSNEGFSVVNGKFFNLSDSGQENALFDYIDDIGYPCVLKPNKGKMGKGVMLIDCESSLIHAIMHKVDFKESYRLEKLLVGNEYRVFFHEGEILFSFRRVQGNNFQKNISAGGGYDQYSEEHSQEMHNFAKSISKVIGLTTFGLDLFSEHGLDPNKAIILEVNAEPGFSVMAKESEKTTKKVFSSLVK